MPTSVEQARQAITICYHGIVPYAQGLAAMTAFNAARTSDTLDAIWLLEHPPVYTLGQAGDPAHLWRPIQTIPLVRTDRGGQMTYHGPGQIVAYLLLDLRRRQLMVRELVYRIEQAIIETLAAYNLAAQRQAGAPGVYLRGPAYQGAKIAALGLKIRNGCSYHGMSLNVAMDLTPFDHIHPCGQPGLPAIDMATLGVQASWPDVAQTLTQYLLTCLESRLHETMALPDHFLDYSNFL